jgi:hypothetical protein
MLSRPRARHPWLVQNVFAARQHALAEIAAVGIADPTSTLERCAEPSEMSQQAD